MSYSRERSIEFNEQMKQAFMALATARSLIEEADQHFRQAFASPIIGKQVAHHDLLTNISKIQEIKRSIGSLTRINAAVI